MIEKGIKVLIVDDFSTMRKIIRGILKKLGFSYIEEADDGSNALPKLRQGGFGLVVCAWNMPNMNGLELLKAIRSDENLKGLLFLMITTETKKENIVAAIKAGENSYIVKPFTEEVLQKKLEEIFK